MIGKLNNQVLAFASSLLLCAALFSGCSSSDSSEESSDSISLTKIPTGTLYPVVNQSTVVNFTASAAWTATTNADWLTITPTSGKAGSGSITVTTASTNRTKSQREGEVIIKAGSASQSVTIKQSGDYAIFDQKEYIVEAEGGTVELSFVTNFSSYDNLTVAYTSGLTWIDWADNDSRMTRAEYRGKMAALTVQPNTDVNSRTALYVIAQLISDDEWIGLDTAYVTQKGVNSGYESTDYSADGTVTVVQTASVGRGIPVVLMGDGFADKDIADGSYDRALNKAIENLFSEEPVKSLKDYFSIYKVTAVSKNDAVGSDFSTAFSCVPDNQSSNIEADGEKVYQYLRKVERVDSLNALAVVILNSNVHNGVTYLYSSGNGSPIQYAACFCPIIQDMESEEFRAVLVHEAIGHGLAKLADEYGYEKNGAATQEAIDQIKQYHQYNWMKNVDTTDDVTKVDWCEFISDTCYTEEAIGVYNGAYTYASGIYRPTAESMMNSNASPFNAPSRKAIYDRVMRLGLSKGNSTYEEFTAFDKEHKPETWEYVLSRSDMPWRPLRFAPPRLIVRRR